MNEERQRQQKYAQLDGLSLTSSNSNWKQIHLFSQNYEMKQQNRQ